MGSGLPAYFKNLSPSKVNGFLEYRSKWFLTDVLKRRFPPSPDMERGKAVEQGITQFLIGNLSLEDAQDWAMKLYREGTADLDINDSNEASVVIPELVKVGTEVLKPYGKVTAVQREIWGKIEGTILDWKGFTDIEFEGDVVTDIKVTSRTPSSMSFGHSRQGAFYQNFIPNCKRVDFVYLIPLKGGVKTVTYTVRNVERHLHDLKLGAQAMHKMLSVSDDPMELAPLFHPAPGDWWLNDPMAQSHACDVWGISDFKEQPKEIAA